MCRNALKTPLFSLSLLPFPLLFPPLSPLSSSGFTLIPAHSQQSFGQTGRIHDGPKLPQVLTRSSCGLRPLRHEAMFVDECSIHYLSLSLRLPHVPLAVTATVLVQCQKSLSKVRFFSFFFSSPFLSPFFPLLPPLFFFSWCEVVREIQGFKKIPVRIL